MKTAISVPDRIFDRAERHAKQLGVSRSEFFTTAAERYADELDDEHVTDAIDTALDGVGADDGAEFVAGAARATFERNPFDSAG